MKKNILAFGVGLLLGSGPMLHAIYILCIIAGSVIGFEIGKH